jgi:hypothetical protein
MLIETTKQGDILTVKLTSGEELVGRLDSETDTHIKLKMPLTLIMSQQGVGLQQYLFTADPEKLLTINKTAIACFTSTREEFAKAYQERTSGFVTPPKNFVV